MDTFLEIEKQWNNLRIIIRTHLYEKLTHDETFTCIAKRNTLGNNWLTDGLGKLPPTLIETFPIFLLWKMDSTWGEAVVIDTTPFLRCFPFFQGGLGPIKVQLH